VRPPWRVEQGHRKYDDGPIPGSNASPGTLAAVLTAKYADGMPLYRRHEALLRGEVDVARGTLAQWCIKSVVWRRGILA
jgi:transposase